MKQYLLLLFFYLLSVNWAFAQKDAIEGKSYILCINSYTESSPWSSRLYFQRYGIRSKRPWNHSLRRASEYAAG